MPHSGVKATIPPLGALYVLRPPSAPTVVEPRLTLPVNLSCEISALPAAVTTAASRLSASGAAVLRSSPLATSKPSEA